MSPPPKSRPRSRGSADDAPSSVRRHLVIDEIMEAAVQIFADRGFQGTGIQDIADAMQMSRPAIYHYFGSKEELLEAIAKAAAVENVRFIRELQADESIDHPEKLRRLVDGLVSRIAAKPAHMRLLAASESSLPPAIGAAHATARHESLRTVEQILDDGIAAGELRPVDTRIAALSLFGMCNWTAWWFRPDGRSSPQEIAREMQAFVIDGLVRPEHRRRADGVAHAIALVREDLEYLERILPTP